MYAQTSKQTKDLLHWREARVWGFLPHLDSREVAQLLSQSIALEARQQMIFRQMLSLYAMPFFATYISSCPENQTRLAWQNFPTLHVHITNQPNLNRISPNNTGFNETVGATS